MDCFNIGIGIFPSDAVKAVVKDKEEASCRSFRGGAEDGKEEK